MIKMKMSVYDDRNVVGRRASFLKERFCKRFLAKDTVHRGLLRGPFFAYPGLNQDFFGAGIDEHTVHVHPYPIEFVGRGNTLPKNTRDDSKHRPAVQSEFRVRNYF